MEHLKNYLDPAIFSILGFMSFLMLSLVFERFIHFKKLDTRQFKTIEMLDIDLNNQLTTIATIGTNAPYVGLLGTVLGILITFYDIGNGGSINAQNIMLGLAFALKATALGLLVAIPSMIFYNGLQRKIEVLRLIWLNDQKTKMGLSK